MEKAMRQYELLQAMTFRSGRFKLTPEQYRRRKHVTKLLDPEQLIVEPNPDISFKIGEVIETDLDVPRAIESKLRPLAPELPAAESEPAGSKPVEPEVSASTDPAAGGSNESEPAAAKAGDTDDPLASLDIGGDSQSGAVTADQKAGRRSRGK
jgi:hypothetical protein